MFAILEMLMLGIILAAIVALLLGAASRRLLFVLAGVTGLTMTALLIVGVAAWWLVPSRPQVVAEIISLTPRVAPLPSTPREIEIVAKSSPEVERPTWVDAPSGLTNGKYERTVSAGPFDTPSQSEYALVEQLRAAIGEYGDGYIRPGAGEQLSYSNRELLELAPRRWVQQVDTSVGPMLYHHARLELDDAARQEMKSRWKGSEVDGRLMIVLATLGAILTAFAVAYAMLGWRQRTMSPQVSL